MKTYQLDEDAQRQIARLVQSAASQFRGVIDSSTGIIADLYAGREPLGHTRFISDLPEEGISIRDWNPTTTHPEWTVPDVTANFFLSRVLHLVASIAPGIPRPVIKSRTPGASRLAEAQQEISQWACDQGELAEAASRAAFLGLTNPFFAIKLVPRPEAEHAYEKVRYEAVEPIQCGYEPFHRRFSWHTYQKSYGDLPEGWRKTVDSERVGTETKPWELVQITEVYHEAFPTGEKTEGCPMSVWIQPCRVASEEATEIQFDGFTPNDAGSKALGTYVETVVLPACPLVIESFIDPAPKEDISPVETASWIPPLRQVVETLVQIFDEIENDQKIVLYDRAAIREEVIKVIRNTGGARRVYAPVDVDDNQRGVNATMRPVERDSILGEKLAALQHQISIFDDIVGIAPMDRGLPQNPEKSATEANFIGQGASRRNKHRLTRLARALNRIFRVTHDWQPILYGKRLDIPTGKGGVRVVPVPDPEVARYTFEILPEELDQLSRRGEAESYLMFLQTASQTVANFRGSIPRFIRELLRIGGKMFGITDIDLMLEQPVIEQGPVDRYMRALQTGESIQVSPQDDHALYLSVYQQYLDALLNDQMNKSDPLLLAQAIQEHQIYLKRAENQQLERAAAAPAGAPQQGLAADQVAGPALQPAEAPL